MKLLRILSLLAVVAIAVPGLAAANEVHWAKITLEMPGLRDYVAAHPRAVPVAFAILKDRQYRLELPAGCESVDVSQTLSPVLFPDGGVQPLSGTIFVLIDAAGWVHVIELPCTAFKPGVEVLPGVVVIGVGGDANLAMVGRNQWVIKVPAGIPGGAKSATEDAGSWGGVKALFR